MFFETIYALPGIIAAAEELRGASQKEQIISLLATSLITALFATFQLVLSFLGVTSVSPTLFGFVIPITALYPVLVLINSMVVYLIAWAVTKLITLIKGGISL